MDLWLVWHSLAMVGVVGASFTAGFYTCKRFAGKTLKLKTSSKKISTMVIGEVIGIYINNKFIKNKKVDSVSMRYISRMGYSEYTTVSSKFNLKRP